MSCIQGKSTVLRFVFSAHWNSFVMVNWYGKVHEHTAILLSFLPLLFYIYIRIIFDNIENTRYSICCSCSSAFAFKTLVCFNDHFVHKYAYWQVVWVRYFFLCLPRSLEERCTVTRYKGLFPFFFLYQLWVIGSKSLIIIVGFASPPSTTPLQIRNKLSIAQY